MTKPPRKITKPKVAAEALAFVRAQLPVRRLRAQRQRIAADHRALLAAYADTYAAALSGGLIR